MTIRRNFHRILVVTILLVAATTALAAPVGRASAQSAVLGSQAWLSIMCKFSNVTNEPKDLEYFQDMYSDTYPGLGNYWSDASYGHIDLDGSGAIGWLNLGQPTSHYSGQSTTAAMQTALFNDCAGLADPSVNFDNVAGINLMFNSFIEMSFSDMITLRVVTLDGDTRTMPVNYFFPAISVDNYSQSYHSVRAVAYGMGHGMGLPDSTSSAGPLPDNVWDLMDVWNFHPYNENEFCPFNNDDLWDGNYGCLPPHPITYHKDRLGWIDAERKFVYDENAGPQTITLERAAQPGSSDYLMAVVGEAPEYITIEARVRTGFDAGLPASGVIIHRVDTNDSTPAHLADYDSSQYSGDAGVIWLPGETYLDNNLSVEIESATASGFVVTISQPIVDNHEPNNSTAAATPITYGAQIANGVIQPIGDEDLYRFSGAAGDVIKVDIDAWHMGSHLNPTLALLNASGTQIAFMDDTPDFRQDPLLYFSLPATGTYYLRVRDRDHPAEGGRKYWYTLDLQNVTAADPREPNNTQAAATPITYGASITNAFIDRPGDEDVYRFSGTAGDGISIRVNAGSLGTQMLPYLIVRNAAGIVIIAYEWGQGFAELSAILPETGTYYLHVTDQMNWKGGDEFGYPLELTRETSTEVTEPNNTRQTASPIAPDTPVNAFIGLPVDVDFYRFNGRAGDDITADVDAELNGSSLDSWVGLYNSAGTLLELNDDENEDTTDSLLTFTLPSDGTYYLKVLQASDYPCGLSCDYTLVMSGATAPPPQPPTAAFSGAPLFGPAPLAVSFTDQSTGNPTSWSWNFGDGGTSTQRNPSRTYTTPGTYTVSLTASNADGSDIETKTAYVTVLPPPPSPSLYVSPASAGTVGGVAATTADILYRDGAAGTWAMHFDGSDVGVTKAIVAFAHLPGGDLLLVFKANQPTPAGTFTPWDVARFTPTSLGNNTDGTFSWYIDGSDVGMSAGAEKIDALDALPDGRVLLSTTGTLSVPKPGGGTLKFQDEDLAALTATQLGATTTGTWAIAFDGTPVSGLKGEDVAGAHVDSATADVYVSIVGSFKVGGISGNEKDILKLSPSGGGYTVTMYWRGPNNGFNLNIGGMELN